MESAEQLREAAAALKKEALARMQAGDREGAKELAVQARMKEKQAADAAANSAPQTSTSLPPGAAGSAAPQPAADERHEGRR